MSWVKKILREDIIWDSIQKGRKSLMQDSIISKRRDPKKED